MVFTKKFLFKEIDHFGSKKGNSGLEKSTSSKLWIDSKNFF